MARRVIDRPGRRQTAGTRVRPDARRNRRRRFQRELSDAGDLGDVPTVPVFRSGTGRRPGIDLTSNRALHEALDEGLELDDRR
jgi:hypothetical protein